MLMRFDPFREVERWTHQLSAGTRAGLMPMDAYRQGDSWVAAFDLTLGEGLDADRVKASYEAGVLIVRLPVAEQAKPRKVGIATGAGQQALEAGSEAA